jgi:hypothetical protein
VVTLVQGLLLLALEERKGAIVGSTVVENSTDHLKVNGLSPTIGREERPNKVFKNEPVVASQW